LSQTAAQGHRELGVRKRTCVIRRLSERVGGGEGEPPRYNNNPLKMCHGNKKRGEPDFTASHVEKSKKRDRKS